MLAEDDLRSAEDVCFFFFRFMIPIFCCLPCLSFFLQERTHYEGIMNNKVLPDIKEAEALLEELQHNRQVSIFLMELF